MKKKQVAQAGRVWLTGAVLFLLRLIQLRTGFDPDTGLALPSLAGRALWILLPVCFAAEALLCRSRPEGGKRSYACCFDGPEGPALSALAAGSFLLMAGGVLLPARALALQGPAAVFSAVTGVLGIAGGAGFLLLARESRGGGTPAVRSLLPAMFFSALFLLSVYLPEESNPVLERFYLPVLAAAMAAYFLYHLSAFFRREGSLRWLQFTGHTAAITCAAAAADCLGRLERLPVYLGFAVIATVFLLLSRAEPLAEPEEPEEDA